MRHEIYVKRALTKLKTEHRMNPRQLQVVASLMDRMGGEEIKAALSRPLTAEEYDTYKPE